MTIDWKAWKYLLGEWEGGHEGEPGPGHGRFSFSFDLDENILVRKSRTVFPPTAERAGYTHDDLLIIFNDFDGARRGIYFDNEQHVIHYEVQIAADKKTITLQSDPVAGMPQFRFVYTQTGKDTLQARFEMTPPDKPGEFFTYIEGPSRRIHAK